MRPTSGSFTVSYRGMPIRNPSASDSLVIFRCDLRKVDRVDRNGIPLISLSEGMDVSLVAGRFYRQEVVVGKTVQPG
jgi:hypothetical protein